MKATTARHIGSDDISVMNCSTGASGHRPRHLRHSSVTARDVRAAACDDAKGCVAKRSRVRGRPAGTDQPAPSITAARFFGEPAGVGSTSSLLVVGVRPAVPGARVDRAAREHDRTWTRWHDKAEISCPPTAPLRSVTRTSCWQAFDARVVGELARERSGGTCDFARWTDPTTSSASGGDPACGDDAVLDQHRGAYGGGDGW
jgi:hypothetical protein